MKNVVLILFLFAMNGTGTEIFAQEKNWKIGIAYTTSQFNYQGRNNSFSRNEKGNTEFEVPNLMIFRKFRPNFEIGTGIGYTTLLYDLQADKTIHALHQKLRFSEAPDYSKLPYKLTSVKYTSKYLNVPLMAKLSIFNKEDRVFKTSLGLRMDNYFLTDSQLYSAFKRPPSNSGSNFGEDLFGNIILTILFGELVWIGNDNNEPAQQIDQLKSSQVEEINQFYDSQSTSYFVTYSPSVSFDWEFDRISFGVEPFLTISPRKINKLFANQKGKGLRAHIYVRF